MSWKGRLPVRKRTEGVCVSGVGVSLLLIARNFKDNSILFLHLSHKCLMENGDSCLNMKAFKGSKETLKLLGTDKCL